MLGKERRAKGGRGGKEERGRRREKNESDKLIGGDRAIARDRETKRPTGRTDRQDRQRGFEKVGK